MVRRFLTARRLVGLALLAVGLVALVAGGFEYTEDRHGLGVGPIEIQVSEKERLDIPAWLGVAAIVAGLVLLALGIDHDLGRRPTDR